MKTIRFATLAIVTAMTAYGASAHDVWLTLSGDAAHRRVLVNYGYPDDRPPALADKVIDLVAIGERGTRSLRENLGVDSANGVIVAASMPFSDDGRQLLAARYDNGFWIKISDGGYRNATRRLVPDASERLWSGKFAKALSGAGAPWSRVLGHDLELVPLADPISLKAGDVLPVQVLFHGKPLPGAQVERGDGMTVVAEKDTPRFTADNNGIAHVPLDKAGTHLLVADHRVAPSMTPDQADADLFNATLWFDCLCSGVH